MMGGEGRSVTIAGVLRACSSDLAWGVLPPWKVVDEDLLAVYGRGTLLARLTAGSLECEADYQGMKYTERICKALSMDL